MIAKLKQQGAEKSKERIYNHTPTLDTKKILKRFRQHQLSFGNYLDLLMTMQFRPR